MVTADVETLFATLRETLVPLVKQIADTGQGNRDAMLRKYYDPKVQWDLGIEGVKSIGFNLDQGRADISVHPFSSHLSLPSCTRQVMVITCKVFLLNTGVLH